MVAYSFAALMFVVPLMRGDVPGWNNPEAVFAESDFDAEGHASKPLTTHINANSSSTEVTSRWRVAVKVKDSKSGRVVFAGTVIFRAKGLSVSPGHEATFSVTIDRSREGGREVFTPGIDVLTKQE